MSGHTDTVVFRREDNHETMVDTTVVVTNCEEKIVDDYIVNMVAAGFKLISHRHSKIRWWRRVPVHWWYYWFGVFSATLGSVIANLINGHAS